MLKREEILNKIINAKDTTYLTHNFHPYPAKFIPQLPHLMIKKFTKENDVVMDPFCGSGTSLVEAKLLNRCAIGVDIHPIAVLMSKVKTTKIPNDELKKIRGILQSIHKDIKQLYKREPNNLSFYVNDNSSSVYEINLPEFPNRDHWFQKNVLSELMIIKKHIEQVDNLHLKDFLMLGLSAIIVQVSNQESETRYAAINKNVPPFRTFQVFRQKVLNMVERMKEFNRLASDATIKVYQNDARYLDFLEDNIVDFIITSPPYPNTYDYYLYHKLRMYILGFDVKKVQDNEIGSRNKHSSKKEDIESYIRDMIKCFNHFSRILKPDKYFMVVVGDSIIRKKFMDGLEITKRIASETCFEYIDEVSYSLNLISKTFNASFRNKSKMEHIILLKNKK